MAIDFACTCGKRLRAREDMAGKTGRCKACGSLYTIPKPVPAAPARPAPARPAAAAKVAAARPQVILLDESDVIADPFAQAAMSGGPWPQQPPRGGGLPGWLVPAVAIGGVVVLGAVGIAIALSASRRDDNPVAANNPTQPGNPATSSSSPTSKPSNRPRQPANWSSDNVASNSTPSPSPASSKPAESPAWASEIADTAAAHDPWIHPAIPAGHTPKVQIPIQGINADQVVFAQHDAPFAIVGRDCWSITTGAKVGQIGHDMERGSDRVRCLSVDGKRLAEVVDRTDVEIWSCEKGELLTTLKLATQSSLGVKFVAFLTPEKVLTANTNPFKSWIQVWDLANENKQVKDFDAKRINQPQEATLSSDGKHLAIVEGGEILVYDTEKGKLVAQMEQPAKGAGFSPLRMVSSLKFSPDGTELAAAADQGARLICWNSRAKVVLDKPLAQMGLHDTIRARDADDLQWLPDASGWLIGGRWLIAKEPERVVWQLGDKWHAESDYTHFLDKDRLLLKMGTGKEEHLIDIPIPWPRINASLAAMKDNAPALIRPGQGVSIQVKLGDIRLADAEQTKQALQKAAQEKLQQSGIRVGDGQPTIFFIYYQEKAGDQVAVYQRNNRFDFRGQDTGQRVQDTRGELQISLWESGAKEPLWKASLKPHSSSSYTDAITEQTVRDSMFNSAVAQLKTQFFPYFLPKDQSLLALPAVTPL